MVTSTRAQAVSRYQEGLLPARLILGRPLGVGQPRRNKLASILPHWHVFSWDGPEEKKIPQTRNPSLRFQQSILPTPGTPNERMVLAVQVAADFLLLATAFAITNVLSTHGHRFTDCPACGMFLLYGAVFTLLGHSERLYDPETLRTPERQAWLLIKVFVWSTVLMGVALAGWARPIEPSLLKFIASAALGSTLMYLYRRWVQRPLRRQANCKCSRNVLIVGAGQAGRELAHFLQRDPFASCTVCGFLDEDMSGIGVLGQVRDLQLIARRNFVDEIIVTVPLHSDVARKAIWQARRNHIDLKIVPDLLGADPAQVALQRFQDIPVITLWEEPVPGVRLLLKRAADLCFSAVGLLAGAPLLAGIAFAIKMDSPGPVLYRAPRVGLKGRQFLCYKFRTMVADADRLKEKLRGHNERAGPFFKLAIDPRVTRVGRFLRRYSLDELPQLWNVLRGEMSLVGPRPHPIDDVERYALEDYQRLEATPGLTGLWQVTARHDPSFQRSMALDREYIGGWSLGMDLRILCKTIGAVVRGEGA